MCLHGLQVENHMILSWLRERKGGRWLGEHQAAGEIPIGNDESRTYESETETRGTSSLDHSHAGDRAGLAAFFRFEEAQY